LSGSVQPIHFSNKIRKKKESFFESDNKYLLANDVANPYFNIFAKIQHALTRTIII